MRPVDFFVFTKDFARLRLAEYFQVTPTEIKFYPLQNGSNIYKLAYKDNEYYIKFSSPVLPRKDLKKFVWDFDIRQNMWMDNKNRKIPAEHRPNLYYLLVGLERGLPKRVFLINSEEVPTSHVRIMLEGKSIYHKYEI